MTQMVILLIPVWEGGGGGGCVPTLDSCVAIFEKYFIPNE